MTFWETVFAVIIAHVGMWVFEMTVDFCRYVRRRRKEGSL